MRPSRRSATASLALLPLLVLGSAGCQAQGSAPQTLGPAPVAADPARDDRPAAEPARTPAGQAPAARAARLGDAVHLRGKGMGQHLKVVLDAVVDPAVSADAARGPAEGKRWFGAEMTFASVGGASYGALGRMWAVDGEGRRHPSVATGKLTTGDALVPRPLAVGEQAEGWVVFEIPENVRIVQLQYREANTRANAPEGSWHI
ncbi:hypothetical protein [Streptomyces sp. NPDC097619]|uniref:hypothetical protein n=1 Tax=Streptomyces sp. NPDC097619 TaxID=3157228 RepID=UPI003332C0EA